MLHRILTGIDPVSYYLIASQSQSIAADLFALKSPVVTLPSEPALGFRPRRVRALINLLPGVIVRAINILALLRQEPVQVLVAYTGNILDIPAAFLASRQARISFFAYIFDDYAYPWLEQGMIKQKVVSMYQEILAK